MSEASAFEKGREEMLDFLLTWNSTDHRLYAEWQDELLEEKENPDYPKWLEAFFYINLVWEKDMTPTYVMDWVSKKVTDPTWGNFEVPDYE